MWHRLRLNRSFRKANAPVRTFDMRRQPFCKKIKDLENVSVLAIIDRAHIDLFKLLDEKAMRTALAPYMWKANAFHIRFLVREMRLRIRAQFVDHLDDSIILVRNEFVLKKIVHLICDLEQAGMLFIN